MENSDKTASRFSNDALSGDLSPEKETLAQRLTRISNSSSRKSMIQNKIETGDRIVHFLLAGAILGFCIYLITYLFP